MAQKHAINGEMPIVESCQHYMATQLSGLPNDIGMHDIYTFKNGYSLSVIPEYDMLDAIWTPIKGLYECAVFLDGELIYTTHITDDVIRRQNDPQVHDLLQKVQSL